jgi:hypothetical protein
MNWRALKQEIENLYVESNKGETSNGWVRLQCPACEDLTGKRDYRGALGVHRSGAFNCFKCGTQGRLEGEMWEESLDERPTKTVAEAVKIPDSFFFLASEDGQRSIALKPAREYVRKRGIPDAVVKQAAVGACVRGTYGGRVVIPIFNLTGDWVGFSARALVKVRNQYVYPEGMDRALLLYNQRALLEETETPVAVVEGCFDALALWPHAVAVMGKHSAWQVAQLKNAKRPVAVVLDGDAWEAGWMLAMQLQFDGVRAGCVRLPPTLDPDQVPLGSLMYAMKACIGQLDPVEVRT